MAAFGSLRRQKPARKENTAQPQRLFMAREPACNVSNHSSSTASGSRGLQCWMNRSQNRLEPDADWMDQQKR